MKTFIIVFFVALVACLAGLGAGRASAPKADPDAKQQKCLYAAVSAYPNLPVTSPALDTVSACKGLPESQKAALRGVVSRFIESASAKSAKEG
jgi:hypothetical protein